RASRCEYLRPLMKCTEVKKRLRTLITQRARAETRPRPGVTPRAHRGAENDLHDALDVAFGEDRGRERNKIAADDLGSVPRIALTPRKDVSTLNSVRKSQRATSNASYRPRLLTLGNAP